MPNPTAKGPRLFLRRRAKREPVYIIRDTGKPERSTGTSDRREAEAQLAEYIWQQARRDSGPASPEGLTVAGALRIYGDEHAPHVTDPERLGYAIAALLVFWGDLACGDVKGETCRRYTAQRTRATGAFEGRRPVKASTARKELSVLQAALRYCEAEGALTRAPKVTLPAKAERKQRWLTRTEAYWLLRGARAGDARHLQRFIIIGLKTGTRKEATLALGWEPSPSGGYINTDTGVLYRRAQDAVETAKRRPPARMPSTLLAHARRWRQDGCRWVCHWKGARVAAIKTAWAGAIRRGEELAREAGVEIDLSDVTPHTLKHTAVTWAMQRGVRLEDAAGFFGTTKEELERTYWHHHPDFQRETAAAMDRRA